MEQDCNLLECDVYLSKDSEVVISHDGSVKRLTGIERDIKDFAFE